MVMSNITINGINPELEILGQYQSFNYPVSDSIATFQVYNPFIPIVSADSVINIDTTNLNLGGFRWEHRSEDTDSHAYGSFKLQHFVAVGGSTDILGFDSERINFYYSLTMAGAGDEGIIRFPSEAQPKRLVFFDGVGDAYSGIGCGSGGQMMFNVLSGQTFNFYDDWGGTPTLIIQFGSNFVRAYQTIFGRRPSGIIYFSGNTTDTPSLTLNVWTKVLGTTTASSLNTDDFTMPANNRMTYNPAHSSTSTSFIRACVSFQNRSSQAPLLTFGIYKNGTTLLTPQCRETLVASSTNTLNATVEVLDTLVPGDYIELWVMSSVTSASGIRVTDAAITISAA